MTRIPLYRNMRPALSSRLSERRRLLGYVRLPGCDRLNARLVSRKARIPDGRPWVSR
jgi:hypothetical protein